MLAVNGRQKQVYQRLLAVSALLLCNMLNQ